MQIKLFSCKLVGIYIRKAQRSVSKQGHLQPRLHSWPGSLQNRRDFLRISMEQGRRRGKREANAKRELRARGGSLKNPACRHTIVQAVPAFKYERSYLIGYYKTRDP